jgi:hypothetical protein
MPLGSAARREWPTVVSINTTATGNTSDTARVLEGSFPPAVWKELPERSQDRQGWATKLEAQQELISVTAWN